MKNKELRMYHFGNMYLSPIQQGIQAAHAQMEMFAAHQEPSKQRDMLYEWATGHKTMICLNGGDHANMGAIYYKLVTNDNSLDYPVAFFSEPGLGDILTNIAILLDNDIFDMVKVLKRLNIHISDVGEWLAQQYTYSDIDVYLIKLLMESRLA